MKHEEKFNIKLIKSLPKTKKPCWSELEVMHVKEGTLFEPINDNEEGLIWREISKDTDRMLALVDEHVMKLHPDCFEKLK